MRAEPSVDLATPAHIRVPYTDALLGTWDVGNEQELMLYGLDAEGLWAWIPATVLPDENTVIADVSRLTAWAVMPGGLMTAWQQRQWIGAPFEPGKRNLLILHGWNASPWDGCMLALAAAVTPLYDNVAAYAYPSALDIAANARALRDFIAAMPEGATFDVIGFSEGGLVARAAGGYTVASRTRTLVTIATPHDGLPPDAPQSVLADEASLQMRAGSAFLAALNASPRRGDVRYFAIAGDGAPDHTSDGLVGVDSALGAGVLAFEGSANVPLLHAPSRDGAVPGMPCDPAVYDVLRAWFG
jgi:hypothetical protein